MEQVSGRTQEHETRNPGDSIATRHGGVIPEPSLEVLLRGLHHGQWVPIDEVAAWLDWGWPAGSTLRDRAAALELTAGPAVQWGWLERGLGHLGNCLRITYGGRRRLADMERAKAAENGAAACEAGAGGAIGGVEAPKAQPVAAQAPVASVPDDVAERRRRVEAQGMALNRVLGAKAAPADDKAKLHYLLLVIDWALYHGVQVKIEALDALAGRLARDAE